MSAESIRRRFRALYKFKELTTTFNDFEVLIVELELEQNGQLDGQATPFRGNGSVEYLRSSNLLRVRCADGECVLFKSVRVKGKKTMDAKDFTNGFLKKVDVSHRFFR